jgi:uncharacterized protein (TIGR00730 family)
MIDDRKSQTGAAPSASTPATPPSVPGTPTTVPEPRSTLIDEIKQTADKLAADGATRGDLKILARVLRELRYAFKVFKPYRRRFKVTVFGSARTEREHPAFRQSVAFGEKMAQAGWMVVTGAGPGIMEGAHIGAGKEMSMGVNIMLPFEQESNAVISHDEKLVHFKYFFTRKLIFVKEVHAVALFPGGFGTQDEGFETLTLVQTGKRDPMPIVLIDEPGGTYWAGWLRFVNEELMARGLISEEDLALFKVTDRVDEAVEEIIRFYSAYNSMRYVRNRLVIRLNHEPSDALVERLNDEFAEILEYGRIAKAGVHRLESDDEELKDLPRLLLAFNRRNFGRLRQMIDVLNREIGATPHGCNLPHGG